MGLIEDLVGPLNIFNINELEMWQFVCRYMGLSEKDDTYYSIPDNEELLHSEFRNALTFLANNFRIAYSNKIPLPSPPVSNSNNYTAMGPFDKWSDTIDLLNLNKLENCRVLVKPNMVTANPPPETTDPELLLEVVSYLHKSGAHVIVGEDPSLFYSDEHLVSSNWSKKLRKLGVDIVRFRWRLWENKRFTDDFALPIVNIIDDVDTIVSLAVWKAHRETGYTGAVKNLMAFVAPHERLRWHLTKNGLYFGLGWLKNMFHDVRTIIDIRQVMLGAQISDKGGFSAKGIGFMAGLNPEAIDKKVIEIFKEKKFFFNLSKLTNNER